MRKLDPQEVICIKPRIIDFIQTNDIITKNKIIQKHVDFLICDAETLQPLYVIELDDRSHLQPDRIARDRYVDSVMQAAGIDIIHHQTF